MEEVVEWLRSWWKGSYFHTFSRSLELSVILSGCRMNYQDCPRLEITIRASRQPVWAFSAFGNLSHFLTFNFFGKPTILLQDISSHPKIPPRRKRHFIVWQISFDAHLIHLGSGVRDGAWSLFFTPYSILHTNDRRKPEQEEWLGQQTGTFRNETAKPTQTLSDVITWAHFSIYIRTAQH